MTSLHADEAFLGHYQLNHDPFAPRVPGFKFFPAQRKPVLGQLHHLARYSQLLLVVTGPLGSGKTLLRQALVASTNKQSVQSVVVSARGAGDAAGVLRQVAQALDVANAEPSAILKQVVQLGLTGQEVYLLVDDAEQLDESALDALLALAAGTPEGRPHVFLFGESSLIAELEQLSGEEELFHVIELQPYEEEETREYLAQRLEGAGQGIELFSAQQISDIHESSDGWPGTINQVARDAMIETMIASRSAVKRPKMGFTMPKKHVLAISAVVVVAIAAAWLIPGRSKAPTTDAPTEQAQLPLGKPTPDGAPSVEFAGSGQPTNLPMVGQPVMREPLAEAAGGISEGDDGVPVEGSSATPPTVTTSAPPADTPASPAPTPAAKPTPAPAQVATAKPAPVAKPVDKPATVAKAATSGGSWYASQPAGHYVVQILGTSSEANAQNFVKEQGSGYRYFKKALNGKPFYVITYGNFANRAAADTAIKALPAKVQAGKPWPRTVASVQQELATAR
ncbi:AAA family ATPase [Pseudomonas sp. CCM 7891]|uniref:AAA family ATPase n=1 Tax=Pseudomonas karstica TaxID=1055468 RepID=A0A7X2RSU3_9PSED|nr:AAA family ATPase [Pseudomonas karstica]MTD18575.1 AAA family ATPase [Pseudomonas karstica]